MVRQLLVALLGLFFTVGATFAGLLDSVTTPLSKASTTIHKVTTTTTHAANIVSGKTTEKKSTRGTETALDKESHEQIIDAIKSNPIAAKKYNNKLYSVVGKITSIEDDGAGKSTVTIDAEGGPVTLHFNTDKIQQVSKLKKGSMAKATGKLQLRKLGGKPYDDTDQYQFDFEGISIN
jgi:hypothetical protein